jgi:undecaprenyl diphosphate synthase
MSAIARFLKLRRAARSGSPAPAGAEHEAGRDDEPCRYLAIIMDGNGRWAQRRKLPVAAGHRAGAKALRRIIERALDHHIEELTVFSFSTENWRRPPEEVAALMDLFIEMMEREIPDLHEQNVRVRFLGRRTDVPPALLERIAQTETMTAANTRMTFYIAFNYGGRAEIVDAARTLAAEMAADIAAGTVPVAGEGAAAPAAAAQTPAAAADAPAAQATTPTGAVADPELLRRYLYAPEMHDPELLIRTSGEMRISNFLLWQLAYTELSFTPKLWPDFGPKDLDEALAEFASRRRRYGARR